MHAIAVADDRVQTQSAVAGLPLARVFMVADAIDHLPRVPAITAVKQCSRLDAAPEFPLSLARLQSPDIGQRPAISLGEGGRRFGFFEPLAQVTGNQQLHAEKRIAARREDSGVDRVSIIVV